MTEEEKRGENVLFVIIMTLPFIVLVSQKPAIQAAATWVCFGQGCAVAPVAGGESESACARRSFATAR